MKLNPLIVAKVLGVLLLFTGFSSLISGLSGISGTSPIPMMQNTSIWPTIFFLQGVIGIILSIGFFLAKRWSVYGYGLLIASNIFFQLISPTSALRNVMLTTTGSIISLIFLALEIYIFYFLYRNKQKFS